MESLSNIPWKDIGEGVGAFCLAMAALSTQVKSGDKWYHAIMDVAALNFGRAGNDPSKNQ